MDNLKDLHQLGEKLREDFEKVFVPEDIELPSSFKHSVTELGDYKYDYKKFLVHIYSDQLNGYIPNQWFIIASFFVDYYIEVIKYKELVIEKLKEAGLNKADDRKVILSKYTKLLTEFSKTKPMSEAKNDATTLVRQEISKIFEKLLIEDSDKEKLIRFVSDYDWWYGGKTIDRGDFYVSPILALAKVVNASHSYIAEICKFYADKRNIADNLKENFISTSSLTKGFSFNNNNQNLQKIFFGAPGSGKSYRIKNDILPEEDYLVFRTTFHPDTDYSSFVGCYKPQMKDVKIEYKFAPQVFTEAYVAAWNGLKQGDDYYLVIEEINRGNCAQIFGDLFQLLDRDKETGFSEYPIKADNDLRAFLENTSDDEVLKNKEGIKDGKLCLPPNLNIIATMNTSDQSLFPMDSAFKRRWSWEYVPIKYDEPKSAAFAINIPDSPFEKWVNFLKKINGIILEKTDSEDKQMGNFFIKGDIEEQEFKDKVMFYLWSEVCKDSFHTKDNFFRTKDREFSYNELYGDEGHDLLLGFLDYIKNYKAKDDQTV